MTQHEPSRANPRPLGEMHSWGPATLLVLAAVSCGRLSDEPPAQNDPLGTGGACGDIGSVVTADDGCNTCICSESGWACGEMACPPPPQECAQGEQKPASDGCNTCTCTETGWACSQMACPPPPQECAQGEQKPASDACNTCTCADGAWLCTRLDCSPACEDGTVKAAGDGCNTCQCQAGEWACTDLACSEPACPIPDDLPEQDCQDRELFGRAVGTGACCTLCYVLNDYRYYDSLEACEASKDCTPGEVKFADDECNTCECASDGTFACTNADCQPTYCGGLGGRACAENEYCAYEANIGGCGFSDASAICRPRPTSCDGDYAPVCGCDGNTYANACTANSAGTGLMLDTPCPVPQ